MSLAPPTPVRALDVRRPAGAKSNFRGILWDDIIDDGSNSDWGSGQKDDGPGPNTRTPRKRIFCLHYIELGAILKLLISARWAHLVWAEDQDNKLSEVIQAARRFRPNLVLMNVLMPKMNGMEMAARFRADPVLANTPIVFVTGLINCEQNGILIGDVPAYGQPISLDDLARIFESHL